MALLPSNLVKHDRDEPVKATLQYKKDKEIAKSRRRSLKNVESLVATKHQPDASKLKRGVVGGLVGGAVGGALGAKLSEGNIYGTAPIVAGLGAGGTIGTMLGVHSANKANQKKLRAGKVLEEREEAAKTYRTLRDARGTDKAAEATDEEPKKKGFLRRNAVPIAALGALGYVAHKGGAGAAAAKGIHQASGKGLIPAAAAGVKEWVKAAPGAVGDVAKSTAESAANYMKDKFSPKSAEDGEDESAAAEKKEEKAEDKKKSAGSFMRGEKEEKDENGEKEEKGEKKEASVLDYLENPGSFEVKEAADESEKKEDSRRKKILKGALVGAGTSAALQGAGELARRAANRYGVPEGAPTDSAGKIPFTPQVGTRLAHAGILAALGAGIQAYRTRKKKDEDKEPEKKASVLDYLENPESFETKVAEEIPNDQQPPKHSALKRIVRGGLKGALVGGALGSFTGEVSPGHKRVEFNPLTNRAATSAALGGGVGATLAAIRALKEPEKKASALDYLNAA